MARAAFSNTTIIVCAYSACMTVATSTAIGIDFRSIDGSGNNIANPNYGATNIDLLRSTTPVYDDGLSTPRGGDPSSLPSARAISNAVANQTTNTPNAADASDWLWQWGQFLDHDIVLTGAASPAEPFNVHVPTGDPMFDPGHTGTQEIELNRTAYTTDSSGVRQQTNLITAYIDASNVYGSDPVRADDLRAHDGIGSLRTSTAAGEVLLPFNTSMLDNAPMSAPSFFIAGDVRANEQIGLTASHTLFVREHNRLAIDLDARLTSGDADLTTAFAASGLSRGDFIYESARSIVGAQMQKITYDEFLPLLLGPDALTVFSAYDSTVDASITNEFATAAYRLGHSMLSSNLQRMTDAGPIGSVALRDAFFTPTEVTDHGIDSLLLGLASQHAEELNVEMIDDVRNFMFGPPGSGGFDLASLNIQRGRDHGIGTLNDVRSDLGLSPYDSYLDMAGGNADLADAFAFVYGSVDEVDLWIGGLAEPHVNGGMVGETFFKIISDQFMNLRDGDSFYYLNDDRMSDLIILTPDFMDTTSLSSIIRRNSSIESIQDNAFIMATTAPVPEPVTAGLALLGVCTAVLTTSRRR